MLQFAGDVHFANLVCNSVIRIEFPGKKEPVRRIARLFRQLVPCGFIVRHSFFHTPAGKLETLLAVKISVLIHKQYAPILQYRDSHRRAADVDVIVFSGLSRWKLEHVAPVFPPIVFVEGFFGEFLPGFKRHFISPKNAQGRSIERPYRSLPPTFLHYTNSLSAKKNATSILPFSAESEP